MRRTGRAYAELLGEIVRTQIRLKDQATTFGLLWSLLNPLLMLGILMLFFRSRMSAGIDNYPLYLLVGIVLYTHFANSTGASMTVLESLKGLTQNAIFPKEVLVLGTVLSRSVELLITLGLCTLVAAASGGVDPIALAVGLPLVLLLEMGLALCVSLALSLTYVFVRDLRHVYQVFLRLLFFVTPIFYAPDFVGDGLARRLLDLNPLAQIIGTARGVLIRGELPSLFPTLVLLTLTGTAMVIALLTFRALEPRFAEKL